MAFGPGKDPDDRIQEPVRGRGQRKDSSAATSAALGDASLPQPPPPPVLPVLRRHFPAPTTSFRCPVTPVHERAGDGRRSGDGSSSAAAEGDWKGKKILSPTPSLPSSRGSRPTEIFAADSGEGTSSSPAGRGLDLRQVKSKKILSPTPSLPSSRGSRPTEIFAADSGEGTSSSPAGRGLDLRQVKATQVKKTLWSELIVNDSENKKGMPPAACRSLSGAGFKEGPVAVDTSTHVVPSLEQQHLTRPRGGGRGSPSRLEGRGARPSSHAEDRLSIDISGRRPCRRRLQEVDEDALKAILKSWTDAELD